MVEGPSTQKLNQTMETKQLSYIIFHKHLRKMESFKKQSDGKNL